MKSKTKLLGIASAAVFGLVSCANDELKEVYEGEEITFSSRVTRATPTTLDNLDGFRVYADADGYTSMFINGLEAKKVVAGSGIYALQNKVTWPVDVEKIRFWAYGPLNANIDPDINSLGQHLNNFEVAQNLSEGGKDHQDLVVTYTEAERDGTSGMQVPLVFHHALSQIEVKIKKGEGYENGRVVKVKGAWIVNVHSQGNLEFSFDSPNNHMSWKTETPVTYGCTLESGTRLGDNTISVIANQSDRRNYSLMALPQKFIKYNLKGNAATTDDVIATNAPNYNGSGTYILVLCRIETEHRFDATPEGSAENPAIGPLINDKGENIGHVHQLFPVTTDEKGALTFKSEAYGYTCVPIEGEWLPGKKYVYTLEFCGASSGAGVYPPDPLPDGLPEGEDRPDGKTPGDPVLDDPITFSVTVTEWDEKNETTPMN